ncbi:MAG: helix-turn-helix domain-containing protein [Pyrinomonadaceae bacterium]
MKETLLTAEQVAEWLNIKKTRVWELVRENQIPFIRLGIRQYRFNRDQILEFIEKGGSGLGEQQTKIK